MAKTTAFFRLILILLITLLLAGIYGITQKGNCPFGFKTVVGGKYALSAFSEQALLQQEYATTLQREISESLSQLLGEKSVHVRVSVQLGLTEMTSKEMAPRMTIRSVGQDIYSISVVALLDSPRDKNQIYQPLSKVQLKRYTDIVKAIIGYDLTRGDRVLVLNQPFKAQTGIKPEQWINIIFMTSLFAFLWILLALLLGKQPRSEHPRKSSLLSVVKDICLKSPREATEVLKRWIYNGQLEQACIIILAIGSEQAKLLFRHLKRMEVRQVIKRVRLLGKIPPKLIGRVLCDFLREMNKPADLVGNDVQAQELLRDIPNGQDMYNEIVVSGSYQNIWDKFKAMDSSELIRFLKTQTPESVAFILFHLSEEVSGQLLGQMPDEMRTHVLLHLRHIRSMGGTMKYRITEKIARDFSRFLQTETAGMKKVSAILKTLSENERQKIYQPTEKQKVAVWQDVLNLSDKQKVHLLTYLDFAVLTAALSTATVEEQETFRKLLTQEQWNAVKEQMLDSVNSEQAKKIIVKTAQELFG